MFKPGYQFLPLIILLFLSCKSGRKYPYAIKDFKKSLQPRLAKIVSTGVVSWLDHDQLATDKELTQLSLSEHPVLRASALSAMLFRKSFNHFDILMKHLDDTANVITNRGEFGYGRMTVSDYILEQFRWDSQEEKKKTIYEVLAKHNYLRSAYTILSEIELLEKYYPFIKDMAIRGKNAGSEIELSVYDADRALDALARFEKKEDVSMIRNLMLSDIAHLGYVTWALMKDMPDTGYLSVYEAYYPKYYYQMACGEAGHSKAADYINSIATYKTNRSAQILDSIYNHKPFVYCPKDTDTNYIRHDLISAILYNDCDAYSELRQQIQNEIPGFDKSKFQVPKDNSNNSSRSSLDRDIPW